MEIMKIIASKYCVPLVTALLGICLTLPAVAQSHGGGGRGGGGSRGGGHVGGGHFGGGGRGGGWQRGGPGWWGVGLGLGLGWQASYFGDPYAGYPADYSPYDSSATVQASPPQVMPPDGNSAPPNSPPSSNWYYCDSVNGYYPYVKQCPEAWRIVPATPPGTGP